MLQVLIVDDEPLARLRLRQLLAAPDSPPVQVAGEAGTADELLALLHHTPCDLVLLDIALPGRDGLKLAEALGRLPQPPAVVFVTAHAEHALRAFDLAAVDYLTKPVRRDRLALALARVAQRRAATAPAVPAAGSGAGGAGRRAEPLALVVSERGRVLRVPATEVLYLKAEQKYVTLVSDHGRWLLDDALADLEQRLGAGFLRVHRNAVVALAAVRALERRGSGGSGGSGGPADSADGEPEGDPGWQLQLRNGDWLAVSRRQVAEVRQALAGQAPGQPPESTA